MTVSIDDVGRVRVITFARPEKLNAFDTALYDATTAALAAAESDDRVGAVVLTGEGRAFSAGQDLDEMTRMTKDAFSAGFSGTAPSGGGFRGLLDLLQRFPKPLLAAVNGIAVGLGFTLLAHCDLVFVAADARLMVPFTKLGVAPEAGSSYLFPARLGWQRAAHILLTGDWVTAEELVSYGLALKVCPKATVLDETVAAATRIADAPLASVIATKTLLLAGQRDAVIAARRREDEAFAGLLGTPANASALESFRTGD